MDAILVNHEESNRAGMSCLLHENPPRNFMFGDAPNANITFFIPEYHSLAIRCIGSRCYRNGALATFDFYRPTAKRVFHGNRPPDCSVSDLHSIRGEDRSAIRIGTREPFGLIGTIPLHIPAAVNLTTIRYDIPIPRQNGYDYWVDSFNLLANLLDRAVWTYGDRRAVSADGYGFQGVPLSTDGA